MNKQVSIMLAAGILVASVPAATAATVQHSGNAKNSKAANDISSPERLAMTEWCLGNGCITDGGAGDWHKCSPSEPNVCRRWSTEKPK